MERGRPVEQHRVILNDLLQDLIHLGALPLHDLLGPLDRFGDALLHQLVDDERLEQLDGHGLGQTALVQPQLRAYDDDRAAGVVHPLAQQVLAETALLALQHVREALERTLAPAPDGLGAAAVVEQGVHRLLQHPLLIPENDLRRLVLDQLGEPVVPVDHPPIQVIEVGRGKASPVQRDQRPEIGRNDRDDVQDHPGGIIGQIAGLSRGEEGIHDLQPLEHLLLAVLAGLVGHSRAQLVGQPADVEPAQQLAHGGRADVGPEPAIPFLAGLGAEGQILVFIEQLVFLYLLFARIDHDVAGVIDHPLQVAQRDVDQVPHRAGESLEEPDVRHGHAELDVAHALPADLAERHLDAAAVADHAAIADPLVLPAVALPVLDRAEDPFAEETVLLRLERPIVDRFRLGHLTPGPPGALPLELQALAFLRIAGAPDFLRSRDTDADIVETRALGLATATKVNHDLFISRFS